jgi:hypothetical protein
MMQKLLLVPLSPLKEEDSEYSLCLFLHFLLHNEEYLDTA